MPACQLSPGDMEGASYAVERNSGLLSSAQAGRIRAATSSSKEDIMADSIRRVEYFYLMVPDKPGEGARALDVLRNAGVNLLAYSGFPEGRRAQLDFVPADPAAFRQVAKQEKWKVKGPKRAFLIQGEDRVGACHEVLDKLAAAKVNVTAMDAVTAGEGRWGAILWVRPAAFKKAAQVLGAW